MMTDLDETGTGTGDSSLPGGYGVHDFGRGYIAEMRAHAAWLDQEGLLFMEEEHVVKDIVARCDILLSQL